jgi:hypothetical protein
MLLYECILNSSIQPLNSAEMVEVLMYDHILNSSIHPSKSVGTVEVLMYDHILNSSIHPSKSAGTVEVLMYGHILNSSIHVHPSKLTGTVEVLTYGRILNSSIQTIKISRNRRIGLYNLFTLLYTPSVLASAEMVEVFTHILGLCIAGMNSIRYNTISLFPISNISDLSKT